MFWSVLFIKKPLLIKTILYIVLVDFPHHQLCSFMLLSSCFIDAELFHLGHLLINYLGGPNSSKSTLY